jgi:signal transduction histidine kinase
MGMAVENVMSLENPESRNVLMQKTTLSEHILRRKNRTTIPVELSISVVHDKNEKPAYIQMLARDISERKQAEKILKRHTRALSIIGASTIELFRSTDMEASISEVLELLGFSLDVFCGAVFENVNKKITLKYQWVEASLSKFFDPTQTLAPYIPSLLELPQSVFSATDVRVKDIPFERVALLCIPILDSTGPSGFLVLFDRENHLSWLPTEFDTVQTAANLIGVTMERMRNEQSLRESEARTRVIVEALPDVLIRIDLSGRVLDFNASPNHHYYKPRADVVGKQLVDAFPVEQIQLMMGNGNLKSFPGQLTEQFHDAKTDTFYEASMHPISDVEALIIIRDVSEQARLNQMKSDFINRASHELRTPLTSAILMAELIQQGGTKDEMDEYIRTLTSELNRQKNLINQLLLAGRLENGAARLEPVFLDLIPVLEESVRAVKPIANKRGIKIQLESQGQPQHVWGDSGGLQQVFINLINNAVKFSPEKTTVDVKLVWAEKEAQISIRDCGLGIPPEAIPHLFERFYRARNVTVAEIPGSGIGLYIVKSLVEELGGHIEVQSELNKGTTFTVFLKTKD